MHIAITLVLILVAAGIAGVFAFGRLVTEDDLRARIIEQAQATSGRTVLIDGPMDVGLMPRPTLSFGETRFLGAGPGAQPVLDVDRIDLALAPFALLRGELEVEGIRLVRPRLRLTEPDQEPVGLLQLLGAEPAIDLPRSLDRLSVIDGELVIGGEASTALIVERIDAEVEAEADRGPFFINATFVREGEPFVLEGRLGRLTADPNTTASLDLRTGPGARDQLALGFQGVISLDRLSSVRGQASLAGSRLDEALELFGPKTLTGESVPLPVPFAVDGVIESDGERGEISNLLVRFGAIEGQGRLGFALAPSRQVDLELEIAGLDTAATGFDPAVLRAAAGLAELPDGEIELSVASLVHNGRAVRDLRLTLGLGPGQEIVLRPSRAVLPGETDLLMEGRITTGSAPVFDGRVSAVTDRFGELLTWLDPSLPGEATARFRTLALEAEIKAEPGRIALRAIDGRLDASKVAGRVELGLGDRPKVDAALTLDRLSLDAYLPDLELEAVATALLDRLRATDVAFELALERLTARELRWSDIRLALEARAGRVDLEEFRAELMADTSLRASGAIDLGREEADLALAVTSLKPGPLLRRFGYAPAVSLGRLGELGIAGTLKGWTGGAEIDAVTRLGRMRSKTKGQAGIDQAGTLSLDLSVDLLHPHYGDLLADMGLGDPSLTDEPLAGAFKVRRGAAGGTGVIGHLALGPSRITGQIDYIPDTPRARLDARLSVAEPRLDSLLPLLALGGYRLDALALARAFPGAWPQAYLDAGPLRALDGRLELSGKSETGRTGFEALVTSDAGLLRLERGTLSFGKEAGEIALEATLDVRKPTPMVSLAVNARNVALDHRPANPGPEPGLSGRLDLFGELRGTGRTLEELIRSSSGQMALTVRDGELALPKQDGTAGVQTETVPLELLEAQLAVERGLADVTRLDLETAQGSFRGDGLVDLLVWIIDLVLDERDGARRILMVGPPDDLQVLVRTPDDSPSSE